MIETADSVGATVGSGLRIICSKDDLVQALNVVSRAVSTRTSVQILSGILLEDQGSELRIAAIDMELSLRANVSAPLEGTVPVLEAIVPARALQKLARIATSGDEVEVGVHENQVIFATSGVWLTTRRIDGQFPNYKQLLPEAFEYELTVPRGELLDVVRRASVMIQRSTPRQVRFAEGELTVIARTHEVGESKESMPVAFPGDTLEIGFNADFLRDGLESLEGDDVRVKLISPLRPAVIQGEGDDFTYLVMPIRLPG